MKCYNCGKDIGVFIEIVFMDGDKEVERKDCCRECSKELFPRTYPDVIRVPYVEVI